MDNQALVVINPHSPLTAYVCLMLALILNCIRFWLTSPVYLFFHIATLEKRFVKKSVYHFYIGLIPSLFLQGTGITSPASSNS
uniref:Uncharacterized protein n=1 Tax=Caenorhabditis japonica TaxID=281687 RepID=A0A8R1IF13_CAEJA